MKDFVYHNPVEVRFGPGVLAGLGARVRAAGLDHVVLVGGGEAARRVGAYDQAVASLDGAGVRRGEVWGVTANPDLGTVLRIAAAAGTGAEGSVGNSPIGGGTGFVAIGGGSVIDATKAAAALVPLLAEGRDPWSPFAERKPVTRSLPVFAVSILSGTGSEMNGNAVITRGASGHKWGMRCPSPVATFVDVTFQQGLPWHLTVNGAADAMSHVLEFSVVGTPAASASAGARRKDTELPFFAEEAVLAQNEALLRTIVRAAARLRADAYDVEARGALAWASGVGLSGLTGVGLGAGSWESHALEHAVSGLHPHVPHGLAPAVIYPRWMEEVAQDKAPAMRRLAAALETTVAEALAEPGEDGNPSSLPAGDRNAPERCALLLRALFRHWGAPAGLSHWGVTGGDVERLVQLAKEYPRPLQLAAERVERVFRASL
ncbi:iron-containing alcohol dehydrogenase [Nitratidesulfovibrio liaohensis]|uniref:Iron-containing alcohol dehydrogenase n=1 Tax=Nitratidesulfovibrio liaohensis TaxID=2604158 RepID=A0ABY9R6Y3_9BACT|nr:iron-containing alcohol dehydrogenase [Nitratidesulfovibrio liaohensis]WMW67066.1 iron-containing alcohol dehydrogenase [Nitratidesulfovibrio liaohensis]